MELRDFLVGAIFGMFLILSIAAAPYLQKVTGNAIEFYAGSDSSPDLMVTENTVSAEGNRINNVGAPVAGTDVTTRNWVNSNDDDNQGLPDVLEQDNRADSYDMEVQDLQAQTIFGELNARAISTEEGNSYGNCASNEFKFVEYCSGDCSDDDAKVTICVDYEPSSGGGGGGGGGGCFVAGTTVLMADGTTQAIETVKPGDRVISYDYESGERTISVVGESLTHTRADTDHWNEGYYHIHTASGKELKVTENHPVAVPRDGQTVHATVDDLNEGDLLRTIQGSSVRNDRIESMDYHDAGLSVVYNLDMERGPENYFVGDGTLVFTGEEAQQFEQLNRRPLPIKR